MYYKYQKYVEIKHYMSAKAKCVMNKETWTEGWAHPRRGRGWLRGPARPLACGAISPASPSLQFPSPQADFCFQASVLRCLAFW